MSNTSLLRRLLGRRRMPGDPGSICGTLAPGERVDVGQLRFANEGGDICWKNRAAGTVLSFGLSADGELCITGLGGFADEGVCLGQTEPGSGRWSFVANVRPERAVAFSAIPKTSAPIVSTGQGDYVRDWPERGEIADCPDVTSGPIADWSRANAAELQDALVKAWHAGMRPADAPKDDQAATLRRLADGILATAPAMQSGRAGR